MNDQPLDPVRSIPAYTADTPTPPPPKSPWKRRIGLAVALLLVIALIAGGTLYWLSIRNLETTDDAEIDAYTTQIAPQVSGRITELLVEDNQHVTAGRVLLRIDPRDYQAKLDLARARAANARAQVEQASAMVAVQQANVDQALANVQVQQSDLTQAQQDYDRYRGIDPRSVTRQSIDNATATFHGAQARLAAAQQTVTADRAQVKSAQAQVLAAQAAVQQEDANVASAELQVAWCTIVAPVDGIVGHRSIAVGNYVSAGQPLFALVQDGRWITANFKETQLARMHPGQPVDIVIDSVPDVTFHGKLDSFQPGTGAAFSTLPAENATGNYVKIVQRVPVKILFDDDRAKSYPLMPGMSVEPSVRVR
jgi:membrane fusion protein (multidrug efflux system)